MTFSSVFMKNAKFLSLPSNTASRKDEVASIRSKFPQKVPVSALSL